MNMNTEPQNTSTPQPNERPNGRREDRRRADRQDRRVLRSAAEVILHLPTGWSATIIEPDPEGTKHARTRLRVLVFENPDKGFKLLPFMTVRHPRRTQTEGGGIEVMDDMDILPGNPLEVALPAMIFEPGKVLEEVCVLLADYAKKQASLPPPSKRPLVQRPFAEGLAKMARAQAKGSHEREQREQRERREPEQSNKNKRNRNRRRHDRAAVLLVSLL